MPAIIQHPAQGALRGNYALLTAGTLSLMLPQQEVSAPEYLEGVPQAGDSPGLLTLAGEEGVRQFAALSAQMRLLPHCPNDRFLATRLGEGGDDIRWCWSELQILIDVELRPQPLPAVILVPGAPVDHYVEFAGKLAFLCTARQLCAHAFAPRH